MFRTVVTARAVHRISTSTNQFPFVRSAKWGSQQLQQFKYFSTPTAPSDRDAQLRFDNLGEKVSIAASLLTSSDQRKKLLQLAESGVLPAQASRLSALWVFICLQNPLLNKYDFDPEEFLKGAAYAIEKLHWSFGSKDFHEYSVDNTVVSENNDLVARTLHPKLYANCLEVNKKFHLEGLSSRLKKVKISKVGFRNIETAITPGDVMAGTETWTDEERKLFAGLKIFVKKEMEKKEEGTVDLKETAPSTAATNDDKTSPAEIGTTTDPDPAAAKPNLNDNSKSAAGGESATEVSDTVTSATTETLSQQQQQLPQPGQTTWQPGERTYFIDDYPAGSVVATVDVAFEAEEEQEISMKQHKGEVAGKGKDINIESTTSVTSTFTHQRVWTFRACISGQEEMDWKVVLFDSA